MIIVHKGLFRVYKQVQDLDLSRPIGQNKLVGGDLIESKPPTLQIELTRLSKGCFTGLEDLVRGN